MFVAATANEKKRPDHATCQIIADVMTANLGAFIRTQESERRRAEAHKAASVLHKFIGGMATPVEGNPDLRGLAGDLHDLDVALKRCAFYFRPTPKHSDWLPVGIMLAEVTQHVLAELGSHEGRSRSSILVQFLSRALSRMGFAGASPAMIEENFREHGVYPGAGDPTETRSARS
jgi:hypothetical protein